jgi:putative DNA primase/helicase
MKPAPIRDDDEWRKTLTATIQAGQCLTIFDNVDHVLSSPSLALALTASTWTDRVLGYTEILTLPQRTIFVGTGNNIALGGDLPRRCYWIRLDAQCSEPWRNRQFRHANLMGWVRVNRSRLLSASLMLARAWFVAGCPQASSPILGSFEEWCRVAGGILEFAGMSGFLGNLDELYKQSDPTTAAWEGLLVELYLRMPKSGFKGAELAARVREDQALRAVLPEDLGDLEPAGNFQRRLGKALLKRVGRRYGESGVHLVRVGTRQGAVVWAIRVDKEDVLP